MIATRPGGGRLAGPTNVKLKALQIQRDVDTHNHQWQLYQAWPWDSWLKPQIDRAKAQGANAVKFFSGTTPAISGTPLSMATFKSRAAQFLDYCDTQRLWVYWALSAASEDSAIYGAGTPLTVLTEMAAFVSAWRCVVAFDGSNESELTLGIANAEKQAGVIRKAVRSVSNVPLGFSHLVSNGGGTFHDSSARRLAAFSDFMDFHVYGLTLTPSTDLATYRAADWHMPFIIGEAGSSIANGAATQRARWDVSGQMIRQPDCFGAVGYTTQEVGDLTAAYAMYDESLVARTQITEPFANWFARS